MRISLGLYIDSALLFVSVVSPHSDLSGGDKHSIPDNSLSPAILPRHTSSQGSYRSQRVPLKSTDAMVKRDDEQIDDLWIRAIDILTSSIPIVAAAHSLEMLYNAILFNALNPWCTQPPQQVLVMTMGRLQLVMQAVVDNGVPQGIPWAFVRNFARNMLGMTAMGFVGTYDMMYMRGHDPSNPPNLRVHVHLRFLWDV